MKKNKLGKLTLLAGLLALMVLTGFSCTLIPQAQLKQIQPIVLNWWRVADGPDAMTDVMANFNKQYTHIRINYQQFRSEEYEQALLQAWAEDRGPDIFSIPNTWVGKYKTFMLPMPPKLTVSRRILAGTIKKDYKVVTESKIGPTIRDLKNNFVGAVADDVYLDRYFYGEFMKYIETHNEQFLWDILVGDGNISNDLYLKNTYEENLDIAYKIKKSK